MTGKVNKKNIIVWLIISFLILFFMIFMISAGQSISYDFSNTETPAEWKFINIRPTITSNGIKIHTHQTSLMLVSGENIQNKSWQDYPFVVLKVLPAEEMRRIFLYWVPDSKNLSENNQLPVSIDPHVDEIIINTQQRKKWEKIIDWSESNFGPAKINMFGFLVLADVQIEIKRINLQSKLDFVDLAGLAAAEYWTAEPVKISSINFQYGTYLLGQPLARILGICLSFLGFFFLIHRNRAVRIALIIGGVACFIAYDATVIHTLLDYAAYGSERSAYHSDKYEEYKSRFGQEFADLADKFEKTVPLKSKVIFPWTKDYRVLGESNWIEFQYYALYQPADIKTADYIFYYYPRDLILDSKKNRVYFQDNKKKIYKVKVIYSRNPSVKILKVLHD